MKGRFNLNVSRKKMGSQQNLMAQRMPARTYVDKKKEAKKRACRSICY